MCASSLLHVPALALQPRSQGLFCFLSAFMAVHESRTVKDYVHIQEVSTAAENQLSVCFLGVFVSLKTRGVQSCSAECLPTRSYPSVMSLSAGWGPGKSNLHPVLVTLPSARKTHQVKSLYELKYFLSQILLC